MLRLQQTYSLPQKGNCAIDTIAKTQIPGLLANGPIVKELKNCKKQNFQLFNVMLTLKQLIKLE